MVQGKEIQEFSKTPQAEEDGTEDLERRRQLKFPTDLFGTPPQILSRVEINTHLRKHLRLEKE
jgi:hypothetical protein